MSKEIAVWLDDTREMPPEYDVCVDNAPAAIELLKKGNVYMISLDYDLGLGVETGLAVAQYIEKAAREGTLKFLRVRVHTADRGEARAKMVECLRNAHAAWNNLTPSGS